MKLISKLKSECKYEDIETLLLETDEKTGGVFLFIRHLKKKVSMMIGLKW